MKVGLPCGPWSDILQVHMSSKAYRSRSVPKHGPLHGRPCTHCRKQVPPPKSMPTHARASAHTHSSQSFPSTLPLSGTVVPSRQLCLPLYLVISASVSWKPLAQLSRGLREPAPYYVHGGNVLHQFSWCKLDGNDSSDACGRWWWWRVGGWWRHTAGPPWYSCYWTITPR